MASCKHAVFSLDPSMVERVEGSARQLAGLDPQLVAVGEVVT